MSVVRRIRRWSLVIACGAALALRGAEVAAQASVPGVSLSFGVDTTAADVGDIVHLVRAYLARPDTSAAARALWTPADSAGDLHLPLAYQGFPATVLGVTSTSAGDGEYLVRILYAMGDSTGRQVMPLALQRLYAVRAPGSRHGWLLSNALSRITRDWPEHRAGRISFHYAPGQTPDPGRAAQAAAFVDSVATLFAVPPPAHLDYYVTASPDEYLRALGLDFFPLPSGRGTATGGQTLTEQHIVLAGDPGQGELYRHELVHAVLGRRIGGGTVLSEGLPVWFGGSKGRSPREMYRLLRDYQKSRPDVTLEALIRGAAGRGPERDDALQATGALVVESVYRRRGAPGLRALLGTPSDPPGLLAALSKHLELPGSRPDALERWWRSAPPPASASR